MTMGDSKDSNFRQMSSRVTNMSDGKESNIAYSYKWQEDVESHVQIWPKQIWQDMAEWGLREMVKCQTFLSATTYR